MNKFNSLKHRFRKTLTRIDYNSVHDINQSSLDFLRNPKGRDLSLSNLKGISFDFFNDDIDDILECFNRNGIVVFPDFIGEKLIAKLESSVRLVINDSGAFGYSRSNNEREFRKFRKARPDDLLVNKRDSKDSGMLDIYNVDKAFSLDIMQELNSLMASIKIKKLLGSRKPDSEFNLRYNSYYNESVRSTRGFHVDAFYPVIKGMIYLSDVDELDSGAYCYVKKSHKANPLTQINKRISKFYTGELTETPIVDINEITPILGKAGTLIFSDQCGAHRGLPQSKEAERTLLVTKFISGS